MVLEVYNHAGDRVAAADAAVVAAAAVAKKGRDRLGFVAWVGRGRGIAYRGGCCLELLLVSFVCRW